MGVARWCTDRVLSLVASFVAIAFSFTSSTGRWRQLSSPRPVHQVQAAAASQSGRLMLTASSSPIAGNTHRFQPSTAEVNYLPAQYIPASTAITLQDQELCTVKPGQWWPKVGVFLRTPEPIYDADYMLAGTLVYQPGSQWDQQTHGSRTGGPRCCRCLTSHFQSTLPSGSRKECGR